MGRLTFATEPWSTVRPDIAPLWMRHHAEIARDGDRVPLDPDWDAYDRMAAAGGLHILTVRHGAALVGYVFTIVSPHLHYRSTLCGFFDLYWLAPEHRKGWAGVRLFREHEKAMRERGVRKLYGQTKLWLDMSAIFDRLGWTPTERAFTKWIGA